jgi:hypothetical protein
MSRYSLKGASKGALTYYVLGPYENGKEALYRAFDSRDSDLVASAETLDELTDKCAYLGYRLAETNRKEDIA